MLRKRLASWAFALGLVFCVSSPAAALSGCMPTTGPVTPTAFAGAINGGFHGLIGSNAGLAAPVTDCSGVPIAGQVWVDLSGTYKSDNFFDGAAWLRRGYFDTTNHLWFPIIGGGTATLASASTTDLCSVPQSFVTITGTTTITSFGSSCVIGQIKFVSLSGALNLTSSSSMLLPTGATIASQAGDQLTAIYTGGNVWRVTQYLRGDGSALTPQVIPQTMYVGESRTFRMTSCPAGWLPEDGSAISRTTYSALFAVVGTTWGLGDGSTTFNIPNSGGRFDRGWISGQTIDSGRTFGSYQDDQLQDHTHTPSATAFGGTFPTTAGTGGITSPGGTGAIQDGIPNSGRHGPETRPSNLPGLRCIKY